jgi:hypothetical protein
MPSPIWLELLKICAAFGGAAVGAWVTLRFKEYLDRSRLREKELQTRWLPLLRTAQDFNDKLCEFTSKYEAPDYRWNDHTWEEPETKQVHPLPLEARDFHELFLLDMNMAPIVNFLEQRLNSGERRTHQEAVRSVRERIHELNGATVILYTTAAYLGYAQRMRRELLHGRLVISKEIKDSTIVLLEQVRRALNGPKGGGFINDLQDLLGESVWGQDDAVIGYYEFRERMLGQTDWDQFTELFRFFVHFHYKLKFEVKNTREALGRLCDTLKKVADAQQHRFSWLRNPYRTTGADAS